MRIGGEALVAVIEKGIDKEMGMDYGASKRRFRQLDSIIFEEVFVNGEVATLTALLPQAFPMKLSEDGQMVVAAISPVLP